MTGHPFQAGRIVDDQLVLGDPYRQHPANEPPGGRIEVVLVGDHSFHIDHAINDPGGVVGGAGQLQEMRLLLCVGIDGPLAGLAMNAHVGRVGQPYLCGLVEVVQAGESSAIEQVHFHIREWPFHLPFRLGPPRPASARPESVMGGEGQKPRVVERLPSFPAVDHGLHVVVQTGGRHASQVLECPDVLAQERLEILSLREVQVLTPGVTQQIAKEIDPARPFRRKVDRVHRPIHLGLDSGTCLETLDRLRRSRDPQAFSHARAASSIHPGNPGPAALPAGV